MQESIAHKTARTTLWSAIERISTLSVQFIITMVLARLLTPSDYGTIAMLTIFIAIAQQFVECGIANALIRKIECTQDDYSTAFFFNIGLSCVVYVLLYLIAPFVARFYDMEILTSVLRVYGISVIFQSFKIVQYAILCKKLEFKKMAKVTAVVTLVSGLFGVMLAYWGYGVWALVAQNVLLAFLTSVAYFIVLRWKPSFIFSMDSLQYLWGFGSKMLASGIISVVYTNVYSLVIGKIYDSKSLGIFNNGHRLSHFYPDIIKSIFVRNSLPILSELQNDNARLLSVYREFIVLVSFLTFPIVMILFVIAKPFILFFLTEKWAECIIYLQIFCVSSLLMPANWINLNLLQALGRSDLTLKAEIIKKGLGITLIFSVMKFGPLVLAICYSLFDIVVYGINLYFAKKLTGLSIKAQVIDMSSSFISSLLSAIVAYCALLLVDNYFIQMILATTIGIITYFCATKYLFRMNIYVKLRELTKWNQKEK